MKIAAITKLMNDHGTKPRIKVYKHEEDCAVLVYEGRPDAINQDVANLTVRSFTALGTGFLEIHA